MWQDKNTLCQEFMDNLAIVSPDLPRARCLVKGACVEAIAKKRSSSPSTFGQQLNSPGTSRAEKNEFTSFRGNRGIELCTEFHGNA
jgi:hypothetical protein